MSDNRQRAQGPIPIPTQEMVTGHQLANLLNVAGSMLRALEGSSDSMFKQGSSNAIDGGAKMAAEQVFVKVCQRMEDIIGDQWRWNTTERDALVVASLDMVRANVKFLETQTAAAASVLRPSARYQPSLAKLPTGLGWAVILGDPKDVENSIVGVGDTPEEAFLAFDDMFAGRANEKMKQWALTREKVIEEHAKTELERRRLAETGANAEAKNLHPGDRRSPRKKRSGSGHSNVDHAKEDGGPAANPGS